MKVRLCMVLLAAIPAIACTTGLFVAVEVTQEVEVTREVLVIRDVEITREIEVHWDMEVTRVVEVIAAPKPRPICQDYPYMLALGELQLGFLDARVELAERAGSAPVYDEKTARDRLANRLSTSRINQIKICGGDFEPFGVTQREMSSFEGSAVCSETLNFLNDVASANPNLDDAPTEISIAWNDVLDGYANYCVDHFLGS